MVGTENVEARGPCPSPALRRGVPREGRGHTCLAPAYVGLSALASGRSDRMFLGPEVPRVSGATDKTSQHRGSAGTAAVLAWERRPRRRRPCVAPGASCHAGACRAASRSRASV